MGYKKRKSNNIKWSFFYNKFPRYREIESYLYLLARTFPRMVHLETIGYSHYGRDIDMIILSKRSKNRKNGVLIDAGMHAREWLTHTTVLYILDHLVRDQTLLRYMDFYIIPCMNPDGYEYTHTMDRLWRKNLNPNGSKSKKKWGVDLNRNFPHEFGRVGSSGDPNSTLYRGKHPLSEPESLCLANVMKKYEGIIKLYISVHSYGNVIMYPWSHTKKPTQDVYDLNVCGQKAKDAIYNCGRRWYKVGSAASVMYLVSGSSTDYAKGSRKVKFAYCIELQKYGKSGFEPNSRHIVHIGEETLAGVSAMVKHVHNYYKKKKKKIVTSYMPG